MEQFQLAIFGVVYAALHAPLARAATVAWRLPVAVEAAAAAAVTVLSYDLATYVAHWLCHRVPALWDFHSVHHSVTRLTPLALYRDHPVDHLLRNTLRGVFTATALAGLHAALPRGTWGTTFLGVGAGFALYLPTVHLQHSHVPVRYPRLLRAWLLSPHLHQLHHSRAAAHSGRNLGVIFPFWDRLFGTYLDEPCPLGSLEFGLAEPDPYRDSLLRLYLQPLKRVIFARPGRSPSSL
jgi:sterol desaturase/sphingolipid hydroxylase (fatty acid hydroxylase superfamily)